MRIIGKKIGCALLISVAINVGTSKVNITEEFLSKKENVESNKASQLAEFQIEFIDRFAHLAEKCGSQKEYYDLITIGFLIEGTHILEYFSEIAAKATMLCPSSVLEALAIHHSEPFHTFADSLVIRVPPWEVAESIFHTVTDPKYQKVYDIYFASWLHQCVDSKGVAIVGCGN